MFWCVVVCIVHCLIRRHAPCRSPLRRRSPKIVRALSRFSRGRVRSWTSTLECCFIVDADQLALVGVEGAPICFELSLWLLVTQTLKNEAWHQAAGTVGFSTTLTNVSHCFAKAMRNEFDPPESWRMHAERSRGTNRAQRIVGNWRSLFHTKNVLFDALAFSKTAARVRVWGFVQLVVGVLLQVGARGVTWHVVVSVDV
jgi:hypothetical protein